MRAPSAGVVLLLLSLHQPGSRAVKQNCNSVLSNQLASFENSPSSALVPYTYSKSDGKSGLKHYSRLRVEELVGQTGSNSTPQSCDHYWKLENYKGEDSFIYRTGTFSCLQLFGEV